ncbi:concanavalin A-like lectin/glucanase domain-containing protein [Lipomyces chichibuensis]|uniref:concanavalin A-like lectin/glucanase domain-containing protein n=1 Tax=Lipomyces chichibuensis TaxID=1546026 RepID=UPI00334399A9
MASFSPDPATKGQQSSATTTVSTPALAGRPANEFFVPKYLGSTCYADCVANSVAVAQLASQRAAQTRGSPGSSTTSSRSAFGLLDGETTPRLYNYSDSSKHSYLVRGSSGFQAFDLQESIPANPGDVPPHLPSCWSSEGVSQSMEIFGDMLEVKFAGPPAKGNEQEAAAVRANHPIPPQCGLFYFEVEVLSRGKDGYAFPLPRNFTSAFERDDSIINERSFIGVGFCGPKVQLNKMPGWVSDSWGYHGDDGNTFACQNSGKQYGPTFSTNDVIGCGINFRNRTAFYTKNGMALETAFKDLKGTLYPAVGMRTIGEHVRANFGQREFVFDIESYMREEKAKTYTQIHTFQPPLELLGGRSSARADTAITQTIHKLISSYLAHNGYVDSVRVFAEDVQKETNTFSSPKSIEDGDVNIGENEIAEDLEAINRQKIRAAVMEGNINRALKLTELFFPKVFEDNPEILFQLKCRKFVELMRLCALAKKAEYAEDDEMQDVSNDDDTDMRDAKQPAKPNLADLLNESLRYGQKLHESYRNKKFPTSKTDVQKALNDIFALMAYPDPINSPVAYLLAEEGRAPVAEDLNSAILVSQGKSSVAKLERLIQHTTMLMRELAEQGGQSAFVNVRHDFLAP